MVTQKKIAKSVKDKKSTVKSKKGEKPKFDIYAPVFKTKMKYVYGWLDYMNKTYEDPNDDWFYGWYTLSTTQLIADLYLSDEGGEPQGEGGGIGTLKLTKEELAENKKVLKKAQKLAKNKR